MREHHIATFTLCSILLTFVIRRANTLEVYRPQLHERIPSETYTNQALFGSPLVLPTVPTTEVPTEITSDSIRVSVHKEFRITPNGVSGHAFGAALALPDPLNEPLPENPKPIHIVYPSNYVVHNTQHFEIPTALRETTRTPSQKYDVDTSESEIKTFRNSHSVGNPEEEASEESNEETSEENIDNRKQNQFIRQQDNKGKPADSDSIPIRPNKSSNKQNPTATTPGIDLELLHSISEQFLLQNGELKQLNLSDFDIVNDGKQKDATKTRGYYNYETEEAAQVENHPVFQQGQKKEEKNYNEASGGEQSESSSEENRNYDDERNKAHQNKMQRAKEYQQVVQRLIQNQLKQIELEREREQPIKQPPLNSFNVDFQEHSKKIPLNYNNQDTTNTNTAPQQPYHSRFHNSHQSSTGQRQSQTSMRQKMNLIRQLQSYNQNNQQEHLKEPSLEFRKVTPSPPSNGYNSQPQQQQAEADEVSVYLFNTNPRNTAELAVNSVGPTLSPEVDYPYPASYTRRPIKLRQQTIIKSHYDGSKYPVYQGTTTSTRPTKASRTVLRERNNNQWVPIQTNSETTESTVVKKIRKKTHNKKDNFETTTTKFEENNSAEVLGSRNSRLTSVTGSPKNSLVNYHPVSIQDIITRGQTDVSLESDENSAGSSGISGESITSNNNPNSTLFSLIDELTEVIDKHKKAATSSEEISREVQLALNKASLEGYTSQFTSTSHPLFGEGNGKFHNDAKISQQLKRNGNRANTLQKIASSQSSQPPISKLREISSTSGTLFNTPNNNNTRGQIVQSPRNRTETLYYYSNDMRGKAYNSDRVKVLMPVKPYSPPTRFQSQRQRSKNPVHVFLNSLHALHDKHKHRQSHVHGLFSSFLHKKPLGPPPEKQRGPPTNELIPSIYDAVPLYGVEGTPEGTPKLIDLTRARRPSSSFDFEAEVVPLQASYRILQGEQQARPLPRPAIRNEKQVAHEDTNKREQPPVEYIGDKYARLGENLFYRVHHIFKQFVPPILHIGPSTPPE